MEIALVITCNKTKVFACTSIINPRMISASGCTCTCTGLPRDTNLPIYLTQHEERQHFGRVDPYRVARRCGTRRIKRLSIRTRVLSTLFQWYGLPKQNDSEEYECSEDITIAHSAVHKWCRAPTPVSWVRMIQGGRACPLEPIAHAQLSGASLDHLYWLRDEARTYSSMLPKLMNRSCLPTVCGMIPHLKSLRPPPDSQTYLHSLLTSLKWFSKPEVSNSNRTLMLRTQSQLIRILIVLLNMVKQVIGASVAGRFFPWLNVICLLDTTAPQYYSLRWLYNVKS